MDFFSRVNGTERVLDQDQFATAIANRFNNASPIFTTRLSPNIPRTVPRPPPPAPSAFTPLDPHNLTQWLNHTDLLILDIRPHAAHSSARIPGAVSLSVPSTLLKRPLFSLQRLSAMLPSPSARTRFSAWRSASHILVYDADAQATPENSNINGLLRKFRNDGFQGELAWLKGGFQAVWREMRVLVDTRPPSPETEQDDDDDDDDHPSSSSPSVLRTRHLPVSAFSLSSTLLHNSPHSSASSLKRPPSQSHPQASSASSLHPAVNPFFDTIRQNIELSHGITERIPLRLPRRVRRRIHDLPFPWLHQIASRAANHRPPNDSSSSEDDDIHDQVDIDDAADALAMQFYRIELAEQRRLMGIMEHHSKETGHSPNPFPFSITAGVEKGAKNRYRHIWPFEHARVRLHQHRPSDDDDDYVNASYVQPLGTNKRYIATQGPLPATFVDFWTLCWEQNVHVIVMLTREVEGAMVKCGSYWTDNVFGPLRLRLVSTTGMVDSSDEHSGFFSAHSSSAPPSYNQAQQPHPTSQRHKHQHYQKSETIKRVFELTHTGYSDAKPRKVVHLQYLDWPDMNVPDDPRGVLGLIKQVEDAFNETGVRNEPSTNLKGTSALDVDERTGIAKHALGKNSPLLLHCSAGVGRTGGFIAVDAVLDSIRRELRKSRGEDMDVDPVRVEKKDDSQSSRTTRANQHLADEETGQTLSSGWVVHVPVAQAQDTEMQIDGDAPPSTNGDFARVVSAASPFKDTKRWAEKVGVETGYGGYLQPTAVKQPPEGGASGSSSSEDSGHLTYSSNENQQRSSSLGTSVSGTSQADPVPSFAKLGADEPRGRTTSTSLKKFPPTLSLDLGSSRLTAPSTPTRVASPSPMKQSRDPSPALPSSAPDTTVSRSLSPSAVESVPQSQGAERGTETLAHSSSSSKSFDYKDPRPLHEECTPPPLTAYEDPIWEVVQDMREQRMSLCQSLRQYVFVHVAIIEGALMVVDEGMRTANNRGRDDSRFQSWNSHSRLVQPKTAPSRLQSKSRSRLPSPPPPLPRHAASQPQLGEAGSCVSVASSTGKRSASPTELLKEGKQGEVLLSKRPSVKRKQGNLEEEETKRLSENARYHEGRMPAPSGRAISSRMMPP